jgi:hypothetical protein
VKLPDTGKLWALVVLLLGLLLIAGLVGGADLLGAVLFGLGCLAVLVLMLGPLM